MRAAVATSVPGPCCTSLRTMEARSLRRLSVTASWSQRDMALRRDISSAWRADSAEGGAGSEASAGLVQRD